MKQRTNTKMKQRTNTKIKQRTNTKMKQRTNTKMKQIISNAITLQGAMEKSSIAIAILEQWKDL